MRNLRSRLKLINILCMICFLGITSCSSVVPEEATPVATPSTDTTPSAILTPTLVPLTPTIQTPRMEQKCVQFLEDLPSTIFDGVIVLRTDKQGEDSFMYYLDLKTNNQISVWNSGEVTISPDGNKVAYWDLDLKSVVIADLTGIKMQIPDPGELLKPAGWLDDKRLMLDKYQRDSSFKITSTSLVVLDVVTGDKEEWSQEYPNFSPWWYTQISWSPNTDLILNPKFKYLIYPSWEDSLPVILWDINSQKEVARIHNGDPDTTPKWSPDGTRFVISAPPQIKIYKNTDDFKIYKNIDDGLPYKGGSDLFLVSYTGKIERLTYFTVDEESWQGAYSWSPDGQYIAFLLETGKYDYDYVTSGELAVVNVKTGDITNYCVGGIPFWTSDGHYILISQTNDALESKAYLLDPQSGDAFLIAEDAFALGGTIKSP